MRGIDCTPDDPVPMTPTRLPVKSTPSCGQVPVWNVSPVNDSAPSIAGMLADDRQPVAMTTNWADTSSPASVRTVQRSAASSNVALVTRVSKRMSGRRPNRSATWPA
jgi:hypothetical protein